jgi:NifU-like protein involved in Fe-S cluster formation
MSGSLYTTDILRLATTIPHLGRLAHAQASAEKRSPTCGSRLIVDVTLSSDRRVAALGLEVNACALGQASANLMAASAIGRTAEELASARDDLSAFLSGQRDDPGDWPGLSVFLPARNYPARHAAIRLAFEAVAEAASAAQR